MAAVRATIKRVAPIDVTVLVWGESGVGKELVARALHEGSPRRSGPFVKVNCAALPFELLESELFGYERGAFTGASRPKPGKFELADGGSIFLDEIGEIALPVQAKLLQVLQDGEFARLGSQSDIRVDVRVIAATNKDLGQLVQDGRFREDLYYRLNVMAVHVPPLARAARGDSRARRALPGGVCQRVRALDPRPVGGHPGAAPALPLAGQRARAGERGSADRGAGQ